jgi:voltage-gated potassium channel
MEQPMTIASPFPTGLKLRQKLQSVLSLETITGQIVNLCSGCLVFLLATIFVIHTYGISSELKNQLRAIASGLLLILMMESLLRWVCAENRLRSLFGFYTLLDWGVILTFLTGVTDLSFLLILRWFRILRLVQRLPSKLKTEENFILSRILLTLFSIAFIASGLIYQVESQVNEHTFRHFFDAFYFSIVTMTTVGFGDILPTTDGARVVTILMIVSGIILIPWQIDDLIKTLVRSAGKVEFLCPNCQFSRHDADAKFCKICGNQLSNGSPTNNQLERLQ